MGWDTLLLPSSIDSWDKAAAYARNKYCQASPSAKGDRPDLDKKGAHILEEQNLEYLQQNIPGITRKTNVAVEAGHVEVIPDPRHSETRRAWEILFIGGIEIHIKTNADGSPADFTSQICPPEEKTVEKIITLPAPKCEPTALPVATPIEVPEITPSLEKGKDTAQQKPAKAPAVKPKREPPARIEPKRKGLPEGLEE
jgi:hypothetical protein